MLCPFIATTVNALIEQQITQPGVALADGVTGIGTHQKALLCRACSTTIY
jgi:hypothetical protein